MAEAEVQPTENREKVKTAIANLFTGKIQAEGEDGDYGRAWLEGEGLSALDRFKMILQRDRIRAAARSQLFKGVEGNRIVFFLNKQVAHVGHVSFSAPMGESPMGPIRVVIESENPVEIINWLTGPQATLEKHRSP